MTYAPAQAAAAYRSSQKLDQRPAAVLAAAHQELAAVLAAAIAAYRTGALDQMCRQNARAVRLLSALITAMQGGSAETQRLVRDYASLRHALNRLLFAPAEIETLQTGVEWSKTMTRMFLSELAST
jgi:hypothetical protein